MPARSDARKPGESDQAYNARMEHNRRDRVNRARRIAAAATAAAVATNTFSSSSSAAPQSLHFGPATMPTNQLSGGAVNPPNSPSGSSGASSTVGADPSPAASPAASSAAGASAEVSSSAASGASSPAASPSGADLSSTVPASASASASVAVASSEAGAAESSAADSSFRSSSETLELPEAVQRQPNWGQGSGLAAYTHYPSAQEAILAMARDRREAAAAEATEAARARDAAAAHQLADALLSGSPAVALAAHREMVNSLYNEGGSHPPALTGVGPEELPEWQSTNFDDEMESFLARREADNTESAFLAGVDWSADRRGLPCQHCNDCRGRGRCCGYHRSYPCHQCHYSSR